MKKYIIVLSVAVSIIGMVALASAQVVKLRAKRININDLPQTSFQVTRYSHPTGGQGFVLDNPDDKVTIVIDRSDLTVADEGSNAPQGYVDKFMQKPNVYRFENKVDGTVFGYLLYAGNLNWLTSYDEGGGVININVIGRPDMP